jgi:ribosome biogenesis SPOUT family RNA methylase Rps3
MTRYVLNRGDTISIELQATEPPYRIHGKFVTENEDYVVIEGTVGDHIGRDIFVPRNRITLITRLERHRT